MSLYYGYEEKDLLKSGSKTTGDIDMSYYALKNVPACVDDADEVSKQYLEGNYVFVPRGLISLWGFAAIPNGWALCDGTIGTPDLTGRFILGVDPGNNYFGNTGGSKTVIVTDGQLPAHHHKTMLLGSSNYYSCCGNNYAENVN